MCVAALFLIAKKQKQLKCPLTDEEKQNVTYPKWSIIQPSKGSTNMCCNMNSEDMMLCETASHKRAHTV